MNVRIRWFVVVLFTALTLAACAQVPSLAAIPQPANPTPTVQPAAVQTFVVEGEQTLIDLYRQVNPSVVSVQVLQRGAGGQVVGGGAGSGFVFDREGHMVTNAHVVRDADLVDVVFSDNTIVAAQIVGLDEDSDLAVLKVDVAAGQLVPLPLGDSDAVVPGQQVVAIGNPFGQQGSMTAGIVSAVGRTIASLTPFSIPQAIQTDAAINPGNSGGPLLNLRGEVIGVNAQIESAVRASAGVGFAIPANIVRRVVPLLIEKGEFAWPWLGVQGSNLTPRVVKANRLTVERGAFILAVSPDSPAQAAGLQGASGETNVDGLSVPVGGDVVVAANGKAISGMDDLVLSVSQAEIGDQVTLTVLRNGKEVAMPVTLTARPDEPAQ